MKGGGIGIIAWGFVCTALLTNNLAVTLWLWGSVLAVSIALGIYIAIKQSKK